MIVVTAVRGTLSEELVDNRRIEWVPLGFEAMAKGHQRIRTDAGTEIGISLDRGARLADGDILYSDRTCVIAVRAAEDDALIISPARPIDWGLVGFHLGNRHCAAFFQEDAVLVPYDHTLEGLLSELGVPARRARARLVGIRATAHSH